MTQQEIAQAAAVLKLANETATALSLLAKDAAIQNAKDSITATLLERLLGRSENTEKDVAEIKALLSSKYVTAEAFAPVKALVYGGTGLMLTGVVASLLVLVIGG